MEVDLVSAERRLYRGTASAVFARSVEGEIGVLPGHVPVLLELVPAALTVDAEDGRHVFAVDGGFLEYRGERLTVLADGAERASEIDVDAARANAERLREGLAPDASARERRHVEVADMRLRLALEHG